jgi:AcrR family transcriptional regulator
MAQPQLDKADSPAGNVTLTRREREKLARRETIIEAAKELFYQKGFPDTTMEEIASAAEVSKGTLYLYFSSKDELYVSIILEGFQIIDQKLEEISVSESELVAKGRSMFMSFVEFCLENREYFRITQYFLSETARRNLPAALIEGLSTYTTGLLGYVADLVAEGKTEGIIRDDVDPYTFAVIAWRTATGLLDLAVIEDETGLAGGEYIDLFEQAFDFLLGGAMDR